MPKIVVDLKKFEEEQKNKVVKNLEEYKEILLKNSITMVLPDLDKEIENIKNFTSNFWQMVGNERVKAFKEKYPEECEEIPPDDIDDPELAQQVENERKEKKFVTDKYGNILLSPYQDFYRYVELTYSTYSEFREIRFLGDSFGVATRYHMGKTSHSLSPTTLKILENLNEMLTGNFLQEIKEAIKKIIKEIDDACKYPNKKPKIEPTLNDWREWGEKYFYPPPTFESLSDSSKWVKENPLSPDAPAPPLGTENTSESAKHRELIKKGHESGELDKNSKPDSSPKPLTQEEKAKKEVCKPDNEPDLQQQLVDLWRKRWEEFTRKHSLPCIVKDVKDCLIPPDFEFCDLFKNIDATSFLSKLSLLKTVGFGEMYDQIIAQVEKDTGAQDIREKSTEMRRLSSLITEEEELLDYLRDRQTELDDSISKILVQLVKIESRINSLRNTASNPLLDEEVKTGLRRKIIREEQRRTNLKIRLSREREEFKNTPSRISTLTRNLEKNREKLKTLETEFESVIEQSKFSKKQSQLIAGGQNLEAAIFIANKEGKLSGLEYTNLFINSIDAVIPFENLCALLFQISFSLPNLSIPNNLDEILSAFTSNFKDMFGDLYEKIALMIVDFILSSLMTAIDLLLSSLCNLLDGTLADSIAAASGELSLENLGEKALQGVGQVAQKFINNPTGTQTYSFGVSTPNSSLKASLNPQQVGGSGGLNVPLVPQIDLKGEGLIDLLSSFGQSSPLAEWRLSPDGKTFTTVPAPQIVDFSQLDSFITSMLQKNIQEINSWSATAIAESFGEREEEVPQDPEVANEQDQILNSITPELATFQLSRVLKASISLLTPTQSISLLTKAADQETKDIVNSLCQTFAPELTRAYPGSDFLTDLLGEIGLAAGSKEFEERALRIRDLGEQSVITQDVVCQRFDNTRQFVRALMSKTIPESLAEEILEEIEKKKIEQFNNIIDSFSSLQSGLVPKRTQNATEFYLDTIDKLLQAGVIIPEGKTVGAEGEESSSQQNSSNATLNQEQEISLDSLINPDGSGGLLEQQQQEQASLQDILKKESAKLISENSTFNAMFDMMVNSIFNPVKNSFSRDISSYINTISSIAEVEKFIPAKESFKDPSEGKIINVTNIEYQMKIKDGLIPAIKIKANPDLNSQSIRVFSSAQGAYNKENYSDVKDDSFFLGRGNKERWIYECLFVPKSLLPYSIVLNDRYNEGEGKTIFVNKVIGDIKEGYIEISRSDIEDEYFYISNGFLEEEFQNQILDLPVKLKITKNEVGNKFIEGFKNITENLNIAISNENINYILNSKHGANNNNPFSLMPNLFNVNQEEINLQNSIKNGEIDKECLGDIADIISKGNDGIRELKQLLPQLNTASEKIKGAIPVWEISQLDSQEETKIDLKTSGLIFTPYLSYFNFYHDTSVSSGKESLNPEIYQEIVDINKFESPADEIIGKNRTFRNLFLSKIKQDLNIENNININFNYLQSRMIKNKIDDIQKDISNSRLLRYYEPETTTDLGQTNINREKRKLIEYLNLTRQPTENEKQDNIDPNIMDFGDLKKKFKEIYEKEEEDPMTAVQARGDANYETKASKASKYITSLAFLRTCIVDHLLKSIFVYDYIKYRDDIIESPFLAKDIGNFVLQEAKRYNLNKKLHKQLVKYYDLLVKDNSISETETEKQRWKEWKTNNSFSNINCSPKLQKIVSIEFKKIVKKLKQLTNCEETGEESFDSSTKETFSKLKLYDVPSLRYVNYYQPESGTEVFEKINILNVTSEQELRKEGQLYIEKYVKLGKFSQYIGDLKISNLSHFKNVDTILLSNSVVTFKEFEELVRSLYSKGFTSEDIFECNPVENKQSTSLFETTPKFGLRISVLLNKVHNDTFAGISLNSQEQHLKNRSYITNTYFGSNLTIENNVVIAQEELDMSLDLFKVEENNSLLYIDSTYLNTYLPLLKEKIYKNKKLNTLLKYCLSIDELTLMFIINSFLIHNDQDGRFLFESTKSSLAKMYSALENNGDSKNLITSLEEMQKQQKEREDNTGNPLGPALEALKLFYRTPIQLLKGIATITDPNIALADKIVQGAAMAGSLIGQKIDIPYKLASLALLPGPLPFTGIPPIPPPLTLYNIAYPAGIMFLLLEDFLKDMPYYQNQDKGNVIGNGNGNNLEDSENPFFCELLPEENENE